MLTVISFLSALALLVYSPAPLLASNSLFLASLALLGGLIVLVVSPLISSLLMSPLQRLEQELVPNLMEIFRKDKPLRFSYFYLYLFSFISILISLALVLMSPSFQLPLLAFWLVAFGGALDLMHYYIRRATQFLDPFHLVDIFTQNTKKAIQNGKDANFLNSLESLSEVALRTIEQSKLALTTQVLDAFPPILNNFFSSLKNIGHINVDKTLEKETGRDEASYTVFYLLQRLSNINQRALKYHLETVCSRIIMILGKIIVYSAKFDLSMVTFPAHVLGQFALKALQHHMNEVGTLGTSTLLEVTRTIIAEVDLTYAELQEPFNTIANNLQVITQEIFKNDKTINLKILTQPLRDFKALFQSEKMAQHRDTPAIIQNVDGILSEFDALEQVMRAIPPIPTL